MRHLIPLLLFAIISIHSCAQSQSTQIGGPCEDCDAVNDFGEKNLKWSDTIYGFSSHPNKIKISGTVYQNDGTTPAEDVILYMYHTDATGRYPTRPTSTGLERRHGYLRTWLKTNSKGNYEFYTTRPASYPNSTIPQHIHVTVKEPDKKEYYIEDFFFADDSLLTPDILNRAKPRGGSGVISLEGEGDIKTASRAIILGLNIPNY
ncbi:MAG: intradiol ring-cleavage dioxygenase [Algicola sp.]|nr:intradiol ring-cleavage dioxygenase [Algicola sp.]